MTAGTAFFLGALVGQGMGVAAMVYSHRALERVRAAAAAEAVPQVPEPVAAQEEDAQALEEPSPSAPPAAVRHVLDMEPFGVAPALAAMGYDEVTLPVIERGALYGAVHTDTRTAATRREVTFNVEAPEDPFA